MVLCLVALAVFAVLGIFSAKYRELAKEAFDCVFRKITLRPCESNLDQRLHAQIVAKSLGFSPKLGSFVNKYFEAFSWIFILLTISSLVLVVQSAYYFATAGTCDPANPQNCIFSSNRIADQETLPGCVIPANGSVKIDYFFSETCPYCKQQEPILEQLLVNHSGQIALVRHCTLIHPGDDALCIAKYGQTKYDADTKLAKDIGLSATPTTVFNCRNKLVGVQLYSQLESALSACQKQ